MIATELESKVYNWLTGRNVNFDFESSLLNGRTDLAGLIIEFLLDNEVALRIQRAGEVVERQILEGIGFRVVDLKESDINVNLDITMLKAISGEEQ